MKLSQWWFENPAKDVQDLTNQTRAEGLHVIGTCGDCLFGVGDPKFGDVYCDQHNELEDASFGCIHFEEKDKNDPSTD